MSATSRGEVLAQARARYEKRGKEGRSRLLDEVCVLCGYERKYAIKVLGGKRPIGGSGVRRGGSPARYGAAEREVIKAIWLTAEQPCGKRLKPTLELWLPYHEKRNGVLSEALRSRVLEASAATLDRLLAPCRVSLGSRGRCGTRPGTLLRSQIPIRTEHWDVSGPGFIEADTVAHCGESMAGEFCWSITATDVHTQWTETRAVPNRSQATVSARIAQIEASLPFPILGFDTDNGGEFLNWHLLAYFGKGTSRFTSLAPVLIARTTTRGWNKRIGLMCGNWSATEGWRASARPSYSMPSTAKSGAGFVISSVR